MAGVRKQAQRDLARHLTCMYASNDYIDKYVERFMRQMDDAFALFQAAQWVASRPDNPFRRRLFS